LLVPGVDRVPQEFDGYLDAGNANDGAPSRGVAAERGNDVSTATAAGTLTAADRCDRCGAQAYVQATMESGFDLLLCAHHFHENEVRLREVAVMIHDESERLAEVPPTAAVEER
jgi:hypothetical protein